MPASKIKNAYLPSTYAKFTWEKFGCSLIGKTIPITFGYKITWEKPLFSPFFCRFLQFFAVFLQFSPQKCVFLWGDMLTIDLKISLWYMFSMNKEKKDKSYTCFSGRKEQFLDHFKELRDENKVFLKLAISPEDLRIWLRSDKDFKLQYESYKNSAKHKLRASILAKALQGSVTRTFVEGVVVKEVHYTDPAMVKLAHQIINADDFDNVKDHLPEEIKVNFCLKKPNDSSD